jgi:hypothetical protein
MATSPQLATGSVTLLIGTRKGAFILGGDPTRRTWKLSAPMFLGHIVHHVVLDPRDRRTILMAARTGHLGPTVFRSTDFGKTWKEAKISCGMVVCVRRGVLHEPFGNRGTDTESHGHTLGEPNPRGEAPHHPGCDPIPAWQQNHLSHRCQNGLGT